MCLDLAPAILKAHPEGISLKGDRELEGIWRIGNCSEGSPRSAAQGVEGSSFVVGSRGSFADMNGLANVGRTGALVLVLMQTIFSTTVLLCAEGKFV